MKPLARLQQISVLVVGIVLCVCQYSGAQLAEAYVKETGQDGGGRVSDHHLSQSKANYIQARIPGHLGLDGAGIIVGVGDTRYIGETHIDMRGRHTVIDRDIGWSSLTWPSTNHGNHTSGTVGGNGNRHPRFAGVAPRATIYSADTSNIWEVGLTLAKPPRILSNSFNEGDLIHSDWYEQKGRYNSISQEIDALCLDHPDKLFVFSAGNSGGTQEGYPENYLMLNPSYGSAKNTLVVGRLSRPADYTSASPFGPTRDGRIKPDLTASQEIIAPVDNHVYESKQGSSMSTPLVSGVAALITQHYRNNNGGEHPDAGLLKAILMNSADYIGPPGPTFAGGFGAVNARRAAEIVTGQQFYASSVGQGQRETVQITVPENIGGQNIAQLKIMLYWHDAPSEPYAASALVNNLDLTVDGGGARHLPWVLDTTPANVNQPATRGIDNLNNVEQVAIDAPAAGVYEAAVTANNVQDGPIAYYLVYSFVLDELQLTFPVGGEKWFSGQTRHILWDSARRYPNRLSVDAEYSTDNGATWTALEFDRKRVYQSLTTHRVWQIPSLPLTSAMVRLSKNGRISVSQSLTISQPITLTIQTTGTSEINLTWNGIDGADRYEVLHLVGNDHWQVISETTEINTTLSYDHLNQRESWFSVRAVSADGSLRSQRAVGQRHVWTNAQPVAVDDYIARINYSTDYLVEPLANDTDADGDVLQIVSVDSSPMAEVSLRERYGKPVIYYEPNRRSFTGMDTITYRITDNRGGLAEGTIFIGSEENVFTAVENEKSKTVTSNFALAQNYPNPFNPETVIAFDLATASDVTLGVYDATGQRITTLVDGVRAAGQHVVRWQGVNDLGQPAASGIYFYRLSYLSDEGARKQLSHKMVLLR